VRLACSVCFRARVKRCTRAGTPLLQAAVGMKICTCTRSTEHTAGLVRKVQRESTMGCDAQDSDVCAEIWRTNDDRLAECSSKREVRVWCATRMCSGDRR